MSRNKFKFRREIIAAGGIQSTGGLQITAASTFVGAVTFTAAPILAAGISSNKGAIVNSTGGYIADHVQTWTGANCERVGTTGVHKMTGYGVTKVALTKAEATGAANFQLVLGNPVRAGVHKYVFISRATGASTYDIRLSNESSAQTFYGSTWDAILLSTDFVGPNPFGVHLIGITTDQWAICQMLPGTASTQYGLGGSTFSAT
jgi:hypothetical protein